MRTFSSLVSSLALAAFSIGAPVSAQAKIADDFSNPRKPTHGLLHESKTSKGAAQWQATNNLVHASEAGDGFITLSDEGVFMGRVAVSEKDDPVAIEARMRVVPQGDEGAWMALGIGNPVLGNPTWGEGLYLIITSQGSFRLCGNPDPGDDRSLKMISLFSGKISDFKPAGYTRVKLEYDRKKNTVSAWVNEAKVTDSMKLAGLGFTVNPVFAGFSGYRQTQNQARVTEINISAGAQTTPVTIANFYMEPVKTPSWVRIGEEVSFKPSATLPTELTGIQGVVRDTNGETVATISRGRDALAKSGWSWMPAAPGFYEVEFIYADTAGRRLPLTRSYEVRASNGVSKKFERKTQGIAVLPSLKEPLPPVGQFGFTYMLNPSSIQLASLIGFDLANIHPIPWGASFTNLNAAIEPEKGKFRWEVLDPHVNALSAAGYEIVGQFCYTPLWASPHPEKTGINICVVRGTTYAPNNLQDYADFATAVVSRYKDKIRMWELWNEPAIPGGSVFWEDTTENYVKMIQVGYAAIKKVQPESEVWVGGLGPRMAYYAFYKKLLELGGGSAFDVLSLHGLPSTDEFRRIEKQLRIQPKPAVSSEWHAILQGNMQSTPILSDADLSLRMMQSLMLQLKQGFQRSVFFDLSNLTEPEALNFARDNGWFTHASGLFRRVPQIEPRQPGVVMSNFLQFTGRKAAYVKELELGERIIGVELSTGNGPLLVIWSEAGDIPRDQIASFASPESLLTDWEGRTIPLLAGTGTPLKAGRFYYLSAPDSSAIARTAEGDQVVSAQTLARKSRSVTAGNYNTNRLFAEASQPAALPASTQVLDKDWELTRLITAPGNETLSARAAVGAHPAGVDITIEVSDSTHRQNEENSWWNGDSVQVAFDCEGAGLVGGNTELIAALTPQGPILWKLASADPRGDIPDRWTSAGKAIKHGTVGIERTGSKTRYQIRLPWSELYPLTYDAAKPLHAAIVVNNNDGTGRAGYLEWAEGIAKDKDPSAYGVLKPHASR